MLLIQTLIAWGRLSNLWFNSENVQPILPKTLRINYEHRTSVIWSLPFISGSRKTWFPSSWGCGCRPDPIDNLLKGHKKWSSLDKCWSFLTADRQNETQPKWPGVHFLLYSFIFLSSSPFCVPRLLVLQRLLCNPLCFSGVRSNGECTQLKRVLELYHDSNMFPFSSLEPTLETREPSQVFWNKLIWVNVTTSYVFLFVTCGMEKERGEHFRTINGHI